MFKHRMRTNRSVAPILDFHTDAMLIEHHDGVTCSNITFIRNFNKIRKLIGLHRDTYANQGKAFNAKFVLEHTESPRMRSMYYSLMKLYLHHADSVEYRTLPKNSVGQNTERKILN
jgi:hypothetical protein